jgi:K+-sensing histidine kinase KdpD
MTKMHASCVSHDMRAPLGSICHMVESVINMPRVSKRVVRLLKPVTCASRILSTQVNNLLDYNLLQEDNFRANPTKINIRKLIEEIVEALSP